MKQNGQRRPEEILAEIERTRTDMDATLSAIEHRLTPGELVDQGLDYLRHSGANDFVRNLGGQARDNPMPVALVSIGLAWLMASGRNSGGSASYGGTHEAMRSASSSFRDKASGAAGRLSETAGSARERLTRTSQSMSETARSARDKLTQARSSASRQVERARGGYQSMMREQPLALGAIGLALGAVFAATAPRTRKEDELMGPARDRLAEQAKEAGKEQLEKAKQVAGAAKEAAREEASHQPATPFPRGG